MEVKMINNRPVKIWTSDVEESAMRQIENLTTLPFLFHHLAIMPDVHTGMGMPIGGVLACKDAVIPNAVGVDIGYGMCAVKTSWKGKTSLRMCSASRLCVASASVYLSAWTTTRRHRTRDTCHRAMT